MSDLVRVCPGRTLFVGSGHRQDTLARAVARAGIGAVLWLAAAPGEASQDSQTLQAMLPTRPSGGRGRTTQALDGHQQVLALTLDPAHRGETVPLLQVLHRSFLFIEAHLRRGASVLVAARDPLLSSAVLAAWWMRSGADAGGVSASLSASWQRVQALNARLHGASRSATPFLPACWRQQLSDLERALKLAFGGDGQDGGEARGAVDEPWTETPDAILALPTLSFAPQFEDSVLDGSKAATTRLLRGPDRLAGVSTPGAICAACTRGRRYALLLIQRTRDVKFCELDLETATDD